MSNDAYTAADGRLLRILRTLEGLSNKAYVDATGKSIGYGHFIKPGEEALIGARLTKEQSEQLLVKDATNLGASALNLLTATITENQKTAIQVLAYNYPAGAQQVVRLINAGKVQDAADTFSLYNKSRDPDDDNKLKVNPVLVARRAYERRLFLTPDNEKFNETWGGADPSSTPTVSGTARRGELDRPMVPQSGYQQGVVGPPSTAAAGADFARASGDAQMRYNENSRILAELRMLNQQIGTEVSFNEDALNRIRREGSGRGAA